MSDTPSPAVSTTESKTPLSKPKTTKPKTKKKTSKPLSSPKTTPITKPKRKILSGIVVSTKNKKTIVVKVERTRMHSFYRKLVVSHKKYHAHDEHEKAKDGDFVKICSCRPISALKKWYLLEILKK